jgi:hypothetical protein
MPHLLQVPAIMRGATVHEVVLACHDAVSTHAPLRGATSHSSTSYFPVTCFNPPTRAGCDVLHSVKLSIRYVSTHAPLRGATQLDLIMAGLKVFQPTHPCGVRRDRLHSCCLRIYVSTHAPVGGATQQAAVALGVDRFQPTHPCGVRLKHSAESRRRHPGFNPRTRAGCDC